MKLIIVLCFLVLCGCSYTVEKNDSVLKNSSKSQIYLYMEETVVEFLQKEGATHADKEVVFNIEAKVIDEKNETIEVKSNAEVKIHGESTIKYRRKSLALDLKDDQMYFNFPYETDEFFLIAMMEDTGYIRNIIGYTVLSDLDLFQNHFEMIHLYFNDIYQGLYLLVEKTHHAIENNKGGVSTVFRRNYGPEFYHKASASHMTETGIDRERKRLQSIYEITSKLSGRAYRDSLYKLIDVPQYCRWLAVNTLLKNGDYLDEVFFYQQDIRNSKQFKINAWDYDDIFNPPHGGHDYENSLIYCDEDPLDKKIGEDSLLYDVFKKELNEIVNTVFTDEYVASLKKLLLEYVAEEFLSMSVSHVMNNFSSNPENAKMELELLVDMRMSQLIYRRDSLRHALQ